MATVSSMKTNVPVVPAMNTQDKTAVLKDLVAMEVKEVALVAGVVGIVQRPQLQKRQVGYCLFWVKK